MNIVEAYIEIIELMKKYLNSSSDINLSCGVVLSGTYNIQRNTHSHSVHIMGGEKGYAKRALFMISSDQEYSDLVETESNITSTNSLFYPNSTCTRFNESSYTTPLVFCDKDCLEEVIFQYSTVSKNYDIFALQCYLSTMQCKDLVYVSCDMDEDEALYVLDLLREKLC